MTNGGPQLLRMIRISTIYGMWQSTQRHQTHIPPTRLAEVTLLTLA